ncbi:MAG: hypothetical protein PHZ02_13630 [Desulfocapsaceae bacterium]|nr:hypothetical protein [Desulfocapsaceae bacterium]
MRIKEYAKISKIPFKTLGWMTRRGFISDPLIERDLIGLKLLENLWGKIEFIRPQLIKKNKRSRKALIDTCDLETKWERYAFSRFMNLEPDHKIYMKHLIAEIELTFRFKLSIFDIKKIYRVRKRVYQIKERQAQKAQKAQKKIIEKSNNDPEKREIVATK